MSEAHTPILAQILANRRKNIADFIVELQNDAFVIHVGEGDSARRYYLEALAMEVVKVRDALAALAKAGEHE